jgi:FkbM family methyltransferase
MDFNRASIINDAVPIAKELNFLFNKTYPLIIFDIGACEGESSIQYSHLFPNSKIYAFEPLSSNIELIQKNFTKYGILNASYFNKALSDVNGVATFHVSSGIPANGLETDWDFGNKSSSLLEPEKHLEIFDFIHFDKKIEVETITLKTFCQQHKIQGIDLIHMDVQGAELMVLNGAENFISSIKAIWLEVSKINFYKDQPLVDDVKEFMYRNNFVLIKDSLDNVQGDQLYVSKKFFHLFKLLLFANFNLWKKKIGSFLQNL